MRDLLVIQAQEVEMSDDEMASDISILWCDSNHQGSTQSVVWCG